jgi:enamidase
MASTLIKGIGTLISGDINNPILDADTILVADGKIERIGRAADLEKLGAETVVDASGGTIPPV